MEKDREIELKLSVLQKEALKEVIRDSFLLSLATEGWQTAELVSTYYDTPQKSLLKNHLTLRIRQTGHGYEATVKDGGKSSGGLHERQEWNVEVETDCPDAGVFGGTRIGSLLTTTINGESLVPLFTTKISRSKLLVHFGKSLVEIAVDQGSVVAGMEQTSLQEIELELKSGESYDLLQLGTVLAKQYPLRLEQRSKFVRGLLLSGLPVRKPAVKGETALAALWAYLAEELQFIAHQAGGSQLLLAFIRFQQKFISHVERNPVNSQEIVALEKLEALYRPLQEVQFILKAWRQAESKDEVTSSLHQTLITSFHGHHKAVVQDLVKELRQGKTTPLILELWAALLVKPQQQEGLLWGKQ